MGVEGSNAELRRRIIMGLFLAKTHNEVESVLISRDTGYGMLFLLDLARYDFHNLDCSGSPLCGDQSPLSSDDTTLPYSQASENGRVLGYHYMGTDISDSPESIKAQDVRSAEGLQVCARA
jgi:hypothetical protein